jgi:hypothetical protein
MIHHHRRRRHHRRIRRNARPGENEIPTVRIVRRPRSNPRRHVRRNAPITPAQAQAMKSILAAHGYLSNPHRRHRRRVKRRNPGKRHMRHRKHRRVRRNPAPPKGKRAGSCFKRKGRWFRVSLKKIRKGRRVVRRRVVVKTTARAAKRSRR